MTLSSSSSLYTMLYDMNNLNPIKPIISPQSDGDRSSPKRRSIFTVSSNNNGPSSAVTVSSSLTTTTTTTGTTEKHDLLNITEHLTNEFKNNDNHDHRYSTIIKEDDDDDDNNNCDNNNHKLTLLSNQSSLDSASSLSSLQNNLEVDNPSQSISNINCCCPSSPKSPQNKMNSCQSSQSDATMKTPQSPRPQKMERHNSLDDLVVHRPKNRSSKVPRQSKNKDRKSNPDTFIKEDGGENDNNNNCSPNKKILTTPAVISIEFCDESTPSDTSSLLSNQNQKDTIQKTVMYKASTAFAMGAVRKLSLKVSKVEQDLQLKIEESAARFILHSLLLNSWRQSRKQNEKLVKENQQYQRTVENMCLQLRVIRQMHRDEKEKSLSRSIEVSGQSLQITNLKKERDKIQSELEKVENELNNCQVFVDTLRNQNMALIMSRTELQGVVGKLEAEKQDEINKRNKTESDILKNQQTMKELREQLHDVTRQKMKWQEEARGQESMVISLKTDVAHSDKKLMQVQNSFNELQREVKLFKEYKRTMQMESQRLKEQLKESLDHVQNLSGNMETVQDALEREKTLTQDMKRLIEEKESQMKETRQDLNLFLQACVDKRRRWANSFHYLVFPLDIFRLMFDGGQQRDHQQYKNQVTMNDPANLIL